MLFILYLALSKLEFSGFLSSTISTANEVSMSLYLTFKVLLPNLLLSKPETLTSSELNSTISYEPSL